MVRIVANEAGISLNSSAVSRATRLDPTIRVNVTFLGVESVRLCSGNFPGRSPRQPSSYGDVTGRICQLRPDPHPSSQLGQHGASEKHG